MLLAYSVQNFIEAQRPSSSLSNLVFNILEHFGDLTFFLLSNILFILDSYI